MKLQNYIAKHLRESMVQPTFRYIESLNHVQCIDCILSNVSQNNSELAFLLIDLDSRNGTYASLAFISGVEHKNPSSGCEITAI